MAWYSRLGEAMSAGLTAGVSAWRGRYAPMYTNMEWDEFEGRLSRYTLNDLYYANLQYDRVNAYAQQFREAGKLYVNTRSIYNPVSRLVTVYANKIYPGALDLENLTTGALPVEGDDKQIAALIRLFRWSNWNSEKQLFVRDGEKFGDSFLRVVDDTASQRVILEVVSPHKVKYVKKDAAGNIKEIWLEYYETPDDRPNLPGESRVAAKMICITEIITADRVKVYHDGKLEDEYDNPFGFVPVVHIKSTDEGKAYGTVRWSAVRPKIDEINSQAALLNDQMRKSIIPYIATIGAALAPGSLTRSAATMDEIINIPLPLGGDVKAVVPQVDIASALNNITSQLDELEKDLPELILYKLAEMNISPSGVAMRQFIEPAVNNVASTMGVYDDGLRRACQMAMTIGGAQGYKDFEGFGLRSFERGDLEFTLRPRDVIYDEPTKEKRLDFLAASGAPQSAIWGELGYSEITQAAWKRENEEANGAMLDMQIQRLASTKGGAMNAPRLNTTPSGGTTRPQETSAEGIEE